MGKYDDILNNAGEALSPITGLPIKDGNKDLYISPKITKSSDNISKWAELMDSSGDYYGAGGVVPGFDYDEARKRVAGSIDPTDNLNEIYAENQSRGNKWANATGKMLGIAGTTFIQSTAGLVYGLGSVVGQGKASAFFNNELTKSLDSFNQYLEKELPNYYSEADMEASIGQKLTTANFWADTVFKNFGFVLGTVASGGVFSAATRSALGLNKLLQTNRALNAASKTGQSYAGLTGKALLDEVASSAKEIRKLGYVNQISASLLGVNGEAGIEAFHNLNDTRETLINNLKQSKAQELGIPVENVTLSATELQNIEKLSASSGNSTFALNTAILGTAHILHFGRALNKGWKLDKDGLGKIIAESTAGGMKVSSKMLEQEAKKGIGRVWDKTVNTAKYLKNPIIEATEEQLQLASSEFGTSYALKKLDKDGLTTTGDFVNSLVDGMSEAYGSQEGWENAIVGFVLGAFGVPGVGGGMYSDIQAAKNKYTNTKELVDKINKSLEDKKLKNFFDHAVRHTALEKEKDAHLAENDVFNYKNAEADQIISEIEAFSEAGIIESYLEMAKTTASATPAEIREIFKTEDGIDVFENVTDAALQEHINSTASKLEAFANKVHNLKVDIDSRFPTASDTLRSSVLHYAATIENVDTRITELSSSIPSELHEAVKQYQENSSEENKNILAELMNQYQKDSPLNNYKEIAEDLSKLYFRRAEFIKLYNSALKQPKQTEKNLLTSFNELKLQSIIDEAEDKAAANWWKDNINKDDHYEIEVEFTELPKTSTTYTYEYTSKKTGETKQYTVELYNAQEAKSTTSSDLKGMPIAEVGSDSFGFKAEKKDSKKAKADKEYEVLGNRVRPDGSLGEYTIPKGSKIISKTTNTYGESKKTSKKIRVKIQSKENPKYFTQVDENGNEVANAEPILISKYYRQINETNTITKAYRENNEKLKRRISSLKKLITSKQAALAKNTDAIINLPLREKVKDLSAFLESLKNVSSRATTFVNPITGKRIGTKQAKVLLENLEQEYQELTELENILYTQVEALEEDIRLLQNDLQVLEEADTAYTDYTVVDSIKEEIAEVKEDLAKVNSVIDYLKRFIDYLGNLIQRLYRGLGIVSGQVEEATKQYNKLRYYNNEQFDNAVQKQKEVIARESSLIDRIGNQESTLNQAISELNSYESKKQRLENKLRLLQEELESDFISQQQAQIKTNESIKIEAEVYDKEQDLNIEGEIPVDNDYSTKDSYSSPKPDITSIDSITTGLDYIKDDNNPNKGTRNPNSDMQRWYDVTETLDIFAGNYFVAYVTPETSESLFPGETLYTKEDLEVHSEEAPNIKVVLFEQKGDEKVPYRKDGKLVYTSTRSVETLLQKDLNNPSQLNLDRLVDLNNTNDPTKEFKYTNKSMYTRDSIIKRLEWVVKSRKNLIELVDKYSEEGEFVFSEVIDTTNGIELGEYKADTPVYPVAGRVVPEGTELSPDNIDMQVYVAKDPKLLGNKAFNGKEGKIYFANSTGKIVKGFSSALGLKRAENIIKLLMLFHHRSNTSKDYSLYSTTNDPIPGKLLQHINHILFFGRTANGGNANVFYYKGKLYFDGGNKSIPFTQESLLAQLDNGELLHYLSNTLHHVYNRKLKQVGTPYYEILDVVKDKVKVKKWNSYEEYLLSERDNGTQPPLGVKIPLIGEKQFASVNIKYQPISSTQAPELEVDAELAKKAKAKKTSAGKKGNKKSDKIKLATEEDYQEAIKTAKKYISARKAALTKAKKKKNYPQSRDKRVFSKKYGKFITIKSIATLEKRVKNSENYLENLNKQYDKFKLKGTTVESSKEIQWADSTTPKIPAGIVFSDTPTTSISTPKNITWREGGTAFIDNIKWVDSSATAPFHTTEETLKEDIKETPKESKMRDPDAPFRLSTPNNQVKLEDVQKAKAWLNKVLSNVNFEVVSSINNSGALGTFIDNCVKIISNATEGTVAHEAFHAVYRMYLSSEEREALHQELRTWKNYDTLYKNKYNEYNTILEKTNLNEEQKRLYIEEEILAEEFSNYMITNGVYGKTSLTQKIKNFFKQLAELLGFIQKPDNIEQLFRNINNATYTNYVSTPTEYGSLAPYQLEANKGEVQFTVNEVEGLMDLLTGWFWYYLNDNKTGELSSNIDELFDNLENLDLDKFYREIVFRRLDILKEEYSDNYVYSKLGSIEAKEQIAKAHLNYLETFGFKITGIEASELTEEAIKEEAGDSAVSDSASYKVSINIDSKSTAPNSIKLLIASIIDRDINNNKKVHKSTNGGKLIKFGKMYNLLSTSLTGIADIEGMVTKLREMAVTNPALEELMVKLGVKRGDSYLGDEGFDTSNFTIGQTLFIQNFWQQFNKANLDHQMLMYKPDGQHYITDANTDTKTNIILKGWETNLMYIANNNKGKNAVFSIKSGKIIVNPTNYKRLYEDTIKSLGSIKISKYFEYLEAIGISFDIPPKLTTKREIQEFGNSVLWIHETINKQINSGNLTINIFSEEADLRGGRLKHLADLAATTNSIVVEPQYIGIDGKPIYNITLNNYLTYMTQIFKQGKHLKLIDNVYTTGSSWVEKLKRGDISIKLLMGSKILNNNSSAVETSKATEGDNLALKINSTLDGKYPIFRPGDKKLEYLVDAGKFFSTGDASINGLEVNIKFKNLFIGEIIRYLKDKQGVGMEYKTYRKNVAAAPMGVFQKMVKPELLSLINDIDATKLKDDAAIIEAARKFMDIPENSNMFLEGLNSYLTEQAAIEKEYMLEYRLLDQRSEGYYNNNAILSKFFVDAPEVKKDSGVVTEYQLNVMVEDYVVNSTLAYIEQSRVFTGNLLHYSQLLKRMGGVVGTKLIAGVGNFINNWIEGLGSNITTTTKEYYNNKKKNNIPTGHIKTRIYDDVKVFYEEYDSLATTFFEMLNNQINDPSLGKGAERDKKIKAYISDVLSPYAEMDEGDGQGYILLPAYREFMIRVAKNWSPKQESAYKRLLEGGEPSIEDLMYFNPIKPQYFGHAIPEVDRGFYPPVFYKLSLVPLIPSMIKDTKLQTMADDMLAKGEGIAVFETVVKVGDVVNFDSEGNPTNRSFYNEDGTSINNENIPGHILPYDFWGIQVEIAPKVKFTAPYGTQKRSLTTFDLFQDGKAKPLYGSAEKTTQLVEEYHALQNEVIDNSFDKLLLELKIIEDTDGYEFTDLRKTLDAIKRSLRQQTIQENVYHSLDNIIDEDGNRIGYVDTVPSLQKVESILTNLINNRVIKQTVTGGAKVQVASSGFEKAGTQRTFTKEQFRGSNDLKMQKLQDGKVTLMEVKLPHYFKQFVGQGNTLDINSLDDRLRTLVTYRIPTDGLHSIDGVYIKEFLPEEAGDIIILPTAVVAKLGSDYDIDKLTIIAPNYKVKKDKKGNKTLEYIEYLTQENSTPKQRAEVMMSQDIYKAVNILIKYYSFTKPDANKKEFALQILENIENALGNEVEEGTSIQDMLDAIEIDKEYLKKITVLLTQIFEESTKAIGEGYDVSQGGAISIMGQNTTKAIYNRNLEIDLEILQAPENFVNLMSPVTTRPLERLANYVTFLREGNKEDLNSNEFITWEKAYKNAIKNETNPTKYIQAHTLLKEGLAFQVGLEGVGVSALQTVDHQNAQVANILLEEAYLNFELPNNYNPNTLSNSLDAYGYPISSTLSAMINAYVDVAKDPFIFRLNAFLDFANTFIYLVRRGVPTEMVALFMSQPIISRYYKELQINKSNFLKAKETKGNKLTKTREGIINSIIVNYALENGLALNKDTRSLMNPYKASFTIEALRSGIHSPQKNPAKQIAILEDFIGYMDAAKDIGDWMKGHKFDRLKPASMIEAKEIPLLERKGITAVSGGFIKNPMDIVDKTFLKSFSRASKDNYTIWRNLFLSESEALGFSDLVLTPISEFLSLNNRTTDNYTRALNKMKNSFVTFLLQTTYSKNDRMFKELDSANSRGYLAALQDKLLNPNSPNSIAKQVKAVQNDKNSPIQDNLILNNYIALVNFKEGTSVETVQFFNKKLTVFEQNQLTKAFDELKQANSELANNLIVAQMFIGLKVAPNSFLSYIPANAYNEVVSPIIKEIEYNIRQGGINYIKTVQTEFLNQFYRNYANEPTIVPTRLLRRRRDGNGYNNYNTVTKEFTVNLDYNPYSPYIIVPIYDLFTKQWTRVLYRADKEDYDYKGEPIIVYTPSTKLGDGMHYEQYDRSLQEAVTKTPLINREEVTKPSSTEEDIVDTDFTEITAYEEITPKARIPQNLVSGVEALGFGKESNLSEKNIFTVEPIQSVDKKAKSKAKIATQYIGFAEGIAGSSTALYAKQISEQSNKVEGINISSRATDKLGKRLTNPNWYAKDLMDVEAPYKANASKIKAPHLNMEDALKYDMNLMYKLQVQKFQRNPELIDEINERGGLEFIKQSSHIVGVKNSRWEGKGMDSNFIKVLAQSYTTVAKELGKFKGGYSNIVNSGNYSSNDVIFVSIGGKRGNEVVRKQQQDRTIKEAIKALDAGATLITDNAAYVESSSYNEGEKRLAANLKAKGYNYSETTVDGHLLGVWNKNTNQEDNSNEHDNICPIPF